MHYVIHCLDFEGAVEKRLEHYEAHRAYLASAPVKTVISGPLLADDEETMIGSCFVIEANDISEVEEFNRNDPFAKAGLWETVSIRAFNKRVDNR
ncbi:MAG: YciI family protein [Pseudomonadota bacterium]